LAPYLRDVKRFLVAVAVLLGVFAVAVFGIGTYFMLGSCDSPRVECHAPEK